MFEFLLQIDTWIVCSKTIVSPDFTSDIMLSCMKLPGCN
jgi:hypothetical protein